MGSQRVRHNLATKQSNMMIELCNDQDWSPEPGDRSKVMVQVVLVVLAGPGMRAG